jgi:DNA-binding MarR family transcriptional regulator
MSALLKDGIVVGANQALRLPRYGDDGTMTRHLYYRNGMAQEDVDAVVAGLGRANQRLPLCEYIHCVDLRASGQALADLRRRLDRRLKTSRQAIERAERQHSLLHYLRGLSVRQFINAAEVAGHRIKALIAEDGTRNAQIFASGSDWRAWQAVWLALPGSDIIRAVHRAHRAESLLAGVMQRKGQFACIWRGDIPRITTIAQMRALLVVAALAGGTDAAHASRSDLMHVMGMDRATITRALADLVTMGIVATARGVVTYLRHQSKRGDGDYYAAVPMPVAMDARLTVGEWRVLLALLSSVGRGGRSRVCVGIGTLAERAGVSRPTVERAIPRLRLWGLIRTDSGRGFGGANEYDLTPVSDEWAAPANMIEESRHDNSLRIRRAKAARAAVSTQKNGDSSDVPMVTPVMDGGDSSDVPMVTPVMYEDSPLGLTVRNHQKERSVAASAYPAACGYGAAALPGSWLESVGLQMALSEIEGSWDRLRDVSAPFGMPEDLRVHAGITMH